MENHDNEIIHEEEAGPDAASVNEIPPKKIRKRWIAFAAMLLVVAAVAIVIMLQGDAGSSTAGRPVPAPSFETVPSPSGGTAPRPGEIVLTIIPEAMESAQIKTEIVAAQPGGAAPVIDGLRTTGAVQANAYKEVPVFPIAGGIVREVKAELGDKVRRDRSLATIFSTELSDAQADYLKMLAEDEEHHHHFRRTVELLEIGAVSREELEMVTARHKTAQAKTASARERLILLGMTREQADALKSTDQIRSIVQVPAPVSGTITHRSVNPGEVVERGKELFRVVDLSNVWVIGQVYEKDFQSVRIGTGAAITTTAYPGRTFRGRVSYIDPNVDPQTRTAQVRMEVANPGEILKLGMFVDINFGDAAATPSGGQPVAAVPREALQMIGAKPVVFVAADQPGVFIQREVIAGPEANGLVPIYSGVSAGERVVTAGSFFLRAESMKLNPGQPLNPNVVPAPQMAQEKEVPAAQQDGPKIQSAKVVLTQDGYEPTSIRLKRDVLARVTFVRQAEVTCGTELIIPEYGIKRELPLNQPVVIEFTPRKQGEFTFSCGMDMLRGKMIVN